MTRLAVALFALSIPAVAGFAADAPASVSTPSIAPPMLAAASTPAVTRNGQDVYHRFIEGLSEPACTAEATERWRSHFGHVPRQLASRGNDVLPLFAYVVEEVRAQHLPTEFALIPFVESGYRPGARSASGPAGLWQFIAVTARNHEIPIRPGYDGRLSPADSTRAAVRYLKTLHGMFAGDWRLAVMAFNAGEYRVFGALKRAGQEARDATPDTLPMPQTTQAYVRKLHALSCLIKEAGERETWMASMDREVPALTAITVPDGIRDLDTLASRHETDAARLKRLNPAHVDGRLARIGQPVTLLVPQAAAAPPVFMAEAPPEVDIPPTTGDTAGAARRVHTVSPGESPWSIAKRYGLRTQELLTRNALDARSVLRPGMELLIDER
ncbi:transglycosylase SLT domain-containing protein [Luteimonas sp. 3794]|uniref:lytic transglycosylase domain-containing protein n=1 Tax=Luteimonas sp. 3794 TaxID=2817730 RepID=UPI0028670954|nr:transglycosylase SLT domain-containing protein [Luteimonas sp. 3794]MDR6992486.1 membrane-bound lytic murein transglycosylase D [Luteimonas sp. 3794]